jgi:hypothetical protein
MRPPEVFVRELTPAEGQRLKRLSKQSKLASTRQRAMVLLASNTLMSAPESRTCCSRMSRMCAR